MISSGIAFLGRVMVEMVPKNWVVPVIVQQSLPLLWFL